MYNLTEYEIDYVHEFHLVKYDTWNVVAAGGEPLAWEERQESTTCPQFGDWTGGYGATITCLDESKFCEGHCFNTKIF